MNRLKDKIKKIAWAVIFTWSLACFLQIPLSTAIDAIGSPRWLPLPWSDMADFVSLPNGKTYISLGFFPRVLCYDKNGHFVSSYPVPMTRGGVQLAVDDKGHLYYLALGKIFRVGEDWNTQQIAERIGCHAWYLDETYNPVCLQDTQKVEQVPGRPVSRGEILFSKISNQRDFFKPGRVLFSTYTGRRDMFRCADGSMLVRSGWSGNSLIIQSPDGKTVKELATPWYWSWAVFPFPGSLGCAAMFLLGLIADRKYKKV